MTPDLTGKEDPAVELAVDAQPNRASRNRIQQHSEWIQAERKESEDRIRGLRPAQKQNPRRNQKKQRIDGGAHRSEAPASDATGEKRDRRRCQDLEGGIRGSSASSSTTTTTTITTT